MVLSVQSWSILFQLYRLNEKGQLAMGERCLDYNGAGIGLVFCPVSPTGPWEWNKVSVICIP